MPDMPTVSVEELIERIRSGSYPPWYLINAAASHLRSLVEENKRMRVVELAANNLVNCPAWDRGNCVVDPEIDAAVDVLEAALAGGVRT